VTKKAYRTLRLTLRLSAKTYHFLVRYLVLASAVAVGLVILYFAGHKEYETLLGAGGFARAIELAGEAAADALGEE
jgi:hypothetical protein